VRADTRATPTERFADKSTAILNIRKHAVEAHGRTLKQRSVPSSIGIKDRLARQRPWQKFMTVRTKRNLFLRDLTLARRLLIPEDEPIHRPNFLSCLRDDMRCTTYPIMRISLITRHTVADIW